MESVESLRVVDHEHTQHVEGEQPELVGFPSHGAAFAVDPGESVPALGRRQCAASFAWLIVYFGISITTSWFDRIAWQDSREFGSRPQARSSRSSSLSSISPSE